MLLILSSELSTLKGAHDYQKLLLCLLNDAQYQFAVGARTPNAFMQRGTAVQTVNATTVQQATKTNSQPRHSPENLSGDESVSCFRAVYVYDESANVSRSVRSAAQTACISARKEKEEASHHKSNELTTT